MKKLFFCLLLLGHSYSFTIAQSIQSPSEFLGYPLGTTFTWHHQMVAYIKYVATQSPKVKLIPYGKTTEGRALISVALTSAADMPSLELIRQNNLKLTGLLPGEVNGKLKPIVYLSYNIHGNESASTEAAMATIYQLATQDTAGWLDELVIVIDPCVNPDGRDRYVNWYKQARQLSPQPDGESWEHREPWPGGRYNHYLFDMNRDWCWQTQQESRFRSANYQRWMPQVHIDFHEMGANSPYFFAPPARPFYQLITPWQREFHQHLGENHARYFDKEGWLYFTKETYDLFYPSYGDTWPTYQGAIGLTYEQGGSGRAGLAYQTETGDTLTLLDRLTHHYTTSLSTIETSYKYREKLMSEFKMFYAKAVSDPPGPYKAYIIKSTNPASRIQALIRLLDNNQIQYAYAKNSGTTLKGFSYLKDQAENFKLDEKDILISSYQPKAHLVQSLFEPHPVLEDSMTYDLTAWALPYAYGLDAYATTNRIQASDDPVSFAEPSLKTATGAVYAYLLPWKDASDVALLSKLLQSKINARVASKEFVLEGKSFGRGTIIVTRADNKHYKNWDSLPLLAAENQKYLYPATTGLVSEGKDFGSSEVGYLKAPKVAIVNGEGVYPMAFGELWFLVEHDFGYPATILPAQYLPETDLGKYDVVILPSGTYKELQSKFMDYVKQGGKLIALEGAMSMFSSFEKEAKSKTLLAKVIENQKEAQKKKENEKGVKADADTLLKRYEDRNREKLSESVPGSIYRVNMDDSHPLAFGEDSVFYIIKRNKNTYPYLTSGGWNVGVYKDGKPVSGFAGAKLVKKIDRSLSMGVESVGKGSIIYFTDSPVFRNFWYSGKLLLGNAIFIVP